MSDLEHLEALRSAQAERLGDMARDNAADRMVLAGRVASDAILRAVGFDAPRTPPAVVEFRTEQRLRVADAVLALRAAELNGVSAFDPAWADLMGVVRDRADRCMGHGIGAVR